MLDFNEMMECLAAGDKQITALPESEKQMLQVFCSMNTDAFLQLGASKKFPVADLVLNAFKSGLGLGLQTSIEGGQVQKRK